MAKLKKNLNLLPQNELDKSSFGRFLKWALTFGRYIIIFTELIVILAFLSRFKLDRDLLKLTEEIKQKQTIINSYAELEKKITQVHRQLDFISKTESNSINITLLLNNLSAITPADLVFEELSLKNDTIAIKGRSLSKNGINTFLNQFKSNDYFSQINLESITTKGRIDPTLEFELTAKLNKVIAQKDI